MSIWMIRAGSHGEFEQKYIQEKRVYATWDKLDLDLAALTHRNDLLAAMVNRYPAAKPKTVINWVSQVWPFAHVMEKGDLVVLPLKSQPSIQIAEITGGYHFEPKGPNPFYHWRPIRWISEPIPRAHFGKDLLYSFGAFLTICRIKRNKAEERILAMRENGWKPEKSLSGIKAAPALTDETAEDTDLEALANDQIAQFISARFKGHGLTRLVEAILRAQGYTTYRSPAGADGGADILAGAGPLGFGAPRLCVEVKSESTPIDRPTVDKLLGAVTKFGAQEGLFVAWGGYKTNVQKELAASYFRVRLWTQADLLEQLFTHYNAIDDDLKAELPLKRIWMVAAKEEE